MKIIEQILNFFRPKADSTDRKYLVQRTSEDGMRHEYLSFTSENKESWGAMKKARIFPSIEKAEFAMRKINNPDCKGLKTIVINENK